MDSGKKVDVIGILFEIQTPSDVNCQGQQKRRLNIRLVDDSEAIITLTVWESLVETFVRQDGGDTDDDEKHLEGQCFAFHNVETREYNGKRTLTSISTTHLNADTPASKSAQEKLTEWWEQDKPESNS